jgi:hypothetical protein
VVQSPPTPCLQCLSKTTGNAKIVPDISGGGGCAPGEPVRLEVLTVVNVNRTVILDVTPCSLVDVLPMFRKDILPPSSESASKSSKQYACSKQTNVFFEVISATIEGRIRYICHSSTIQAVHASEATNVLDQYLYRIFIALMLSCDSDYRRGLDWKLDL